MTNKFWQLVALIVSQPAIANWLINRSKRTPYQHIMSADGSDIYMGRWWLFNPYSRETNEPKLWWCPWSVRIHHIMREDQDRDLHDHPWNARTIILRGSYTEQRLFDMEPGALMEFLHRIPSGAKNVQATEYIDRNPGDTATLNFGEYHRIDSVSEGGVYTLFITGKYQGTWGFLVNGIKVQWRIYLGLDK